VSAKFVGSAGGSLGDRIDVAATNTSIAADDLPTLVITTAAVELSERDRQTQPDSERLFSIRVDVPGLPVTAWSNLSGPLYPAR